MSCKYLSLSNKLTVSGVTLVNTLLSYPIEKADKNEKKIERFFEIAFSFPPLTSPLAYLFKRFSVYSQAAYLLFPPEAETTFPPTYTICWLSLPHGISQWGSWQATWFTTYFLLDNESSYRKQPITRCLKAPRASRYHTFLWFILLPLKAAHGCGRHGWAVCSGRGGCEESADGKQL